MQLKLIKTHVHGVDMYIIILQLIITALILKLYMEGPEQSYMFYV